MKTTSLKEKKKSSIRGFWLQGIGVVAAGALLGIGILFWYTPRSYQPQKEEPASLYLTHKLLPEFHNEVQKGKPFELIIPQSILNEMISQQFRPEELGDISFSSPYIALSDQMIVLMGTLGYENVSSVLSIAALPILDSEGQINMNIQSIRLGMVPMKTLVTKLAQKAFDDNRDDFEDDPRAEKTIQAIIDNEPFEPIFLFSTEYFESWVRISKFSIEPGILKLTLSPEEG